MKIAFLGLGRMGRELATHLITDQHDVVVWNRSAAATVPLTALGATAAAEPSSAVADAEVVITALYGPQAVREVLVDADLPIPREALWIDITTVGPADTETYASWASQHAVRYVHAPVIGSLGPARARKLGVLFGGDSRAVEEARRLTVWADPARVRTFDTPGKAAAAKLIANLTVAVTMQGVVETLRLGHSNELSTADVLDTLDLTMFAPMKAMKAENIGTGVFTPTQFSAGLLAKDLLLMQHNSDYPLPAVGTILESLLVAIRTGHAEEDFSVVVAPEIS
jgi:3-hydroxyisobutyrate dehydrogenase